MGLKPHLNWIRWGLAPPQLYTTFRVAEPPDLDAVLFYAHIAQGVITKHSQTIPYTDNRPTSTNHVQACIVLIRKMAQPQQISLDEFLRYSRSFDRWLSGHNLGKQASHAGALVNSKLECDVIDARLNKCLRRLSVIECIMLLISDQYC